VVSAWEPEVAALRRRLRRGRVAGIRVECHPVGVGAVDAAAGAALAIAQVAPARVVFVGTAGRYPGAATARALRIGAVALPDELLLLSTAALRGDGYFPTPLVQHSAADLPLVEALRAASPQSSWRGAAATTLAITRSATLARRITRASGAEVENLEVFAVARAAARAGVPMAAALGIANTVGPTAHTEWRRHHLAASRAACAVVWAWLRAGEGRGT
jgi:purine-nucleoside phosphorylase